MAGCALLIATATRPVHSETELEVAEYAGSTSGGWACGPVGRARYAGVGAELNSTSRPRLGKQGPGWTGVVGGGVEYERVTLLECDFGDSTCPDCSCEQGPPNRLLTGVGVRGGYYERWGGLELGPLLFWGWQDHDDSDASWAVLPQVELSVGRRDRWYAVFGRGAPLVTSYRRPAALYAGLDGPLHRDHRLLLRWGLWRAGPDLWATEAGAFSWLAGAPRIDAVWRASVTDSFRLRLGGSVGTGGSKSNDTDHEVSFGLIADL